MCLGQGGDDMFIIMIIIIITSACPYVRARTCVAIRATKKQTISNLEKAHTQVPSVNCDVISNEEEEEL